MATKADNLKTLTQTRSSAAQPIPDRMARHAAAIQAAYILELNRGNGSRTRSPLARAPLAR